MLTKRCCSMPSPPLSLAASAFLEESHKADWPATLVQLFGYAIITAILSSFAVSTSTSLLGQSVGISHSTATIASTAGSFVAALIGFFLLQGLFYGLAKVFGGQ